MRGDRFGEMTRVSSREHKVDMRALNQATASPMHTAMRESYGRVRWFRKAVYSDWITYISVHFLCNYIIIFPMTDNIRS
jgi:hypothetical protein